MVSENPYQSSEVTDALPRRRGPWLFRSIVMGAVGVVLLFGGFVYGVAMVGVPYQDPTPEIAKRIAFHSNVSGWAMAIGGVILLLAVVASVAVSVVRFVVRTRS